MIEQPILDRRAKKEARRQKQRQANLGRAEKMHKLRLAAEEPEIFKIDSKEIRKKAPQFHVGCSGWFYWDWRGRFYPADLPTNQWFGRYAGKFQTVELNAPFYSWPTMGTVKTWLRQIGRRRNFVYTVKVCELITHIKQFKGTKELIKDFGFIADILGPRLGCLLFQLPPSFHYTPSRLKAIVNQLEPARRNVVEFRHPSWWNEKVYDAFRQAGIIFCSCSGPRLPDELIKTADDVYIRFHGIKKWYRHDYTKTELSEWVQRIRKSGAKNVWAYFNNDYEGYAIKNAQQFLRQLKAPIK